MSDIKVIKLEEVLKRLESKIKDPLLRRKVFKAIKYFIFALFAIAFTGGISYAGYTFYASNSLEDNYPKNTDGLVLDMNLSENNYATSTKTFTDNSGAGNNGVSTNAVSFVTDNYGNSNGAMSFNGSSDYILVPNSSSLNPASITISMWLKLITDPECDSNNNWRSVLHKGTTSAASTGYDIILEQGRGIAWDTGTGTTDRWWPPNSTIPIGTWTQLTLTYNELGQKQAFINGGLVGTKSVTPAPLSSNASDLLINNSSISCPNGSGNFPGLIKEVKIFDKALTADEIYKLYNDDKSGLVLNLDLSEDNYDSSTKTFRDDSRLGNHGTSTNAVVFTTDNNGDDNGAMSFNGSSDNINITSVDDFDDISIGAWINADVDTHIWSTIVASQAFRFSISALNKIAIGWTDGVSTTHIYSSTNFSLGEWHFVSMTKFGNLFKLYIDGVESGEGTIVYDSAISSLRIGRDLLSGIGGHDTIKASISSVKIYNRALSATEITNLYNDSKPKLKQSTLSKGLVGHWMLDSESERTEETVNYVPNPLFSSGWSVSSYSGNTCSIEIINIDGIPTMHIYNIVQPDSGNLDYPRVVGSNFSSVITGSITQSMIVKSLNGTSTLKFRIYENGSTKITQEVIPTVEFTRYTNIFNTSYNLDRSYFNPQAGDEYWIQHPQIENKDHVTPFVEGTRYKQTIDKTPYANHGTIYGATTTTDRMGQANKAFAFDGVDDYVHADISIPKDNFSFSLWFKIAQNATSLSAWQNIIFGDGWRLYQHSANNAIYFYKSGARLISWQPSVGEWHHLSCSVISVGDAVTNYEANCYADGVLKSLSQSGYLNPTTYLNIGQSTALGNIDISDVRIYNRALSQDEITSLYGSYRPKISAGSLQKGLVLDMPMNSTYYNSSTLRMDDRSAYSNHGTNSGGTVGADYTSFDGSGTIDGVVYGDNVVIPESITNTSNYQNGSTYSIWINVDTDAVDRMSLFWGNGTMRHIEINSSSKSFRTEAALQNGYSFGTGGFPDDVRGVWSHFVIVFANNEENRPVRWYQNGDLFYTGNMTGGTFPDTEYFSFSRLGRSTGNTSYLYAKSFDGKAQDLKIYNRALSAEEVELLYDKGR